MKAEFTVQRHYVLEYQPEDEHGPAGIFVYRRPDLERHLLVWSVQHGLKNAYPDSDLLLLLDHQERQELAHRCNKLMQKVDGKN